MQPGLHPTIVGHSVVRLEGACAANAAQRGEAIGGKIIANQGESHRELITPSSQKIFSIWGHNAQEAYVKYLQTALFYMSAYGLVT